MPQRKQLTWAELRVGLFVLVGLAVLAAGIFYVTGAGIPGAEEKAIKEVVERSAELLGNLTALTDDAQEMVAGIKAGRGTLGKLLTDEQAYSHLNSILAHGDQMVTNVQQGQGTLGKLVAS